QDIAVAERVCAALEAAGIGCWIAPRDILAGQDYGEALVEAIEGSKLLVLVFSAAANASPQVRREVERAASLDVAILPFRIDEVPPSKSLQYFISTSHWLTAANPPSEQHLATLAQVVTRLLARATA